MTTCRIDDEKQFLLDNPKREMSGLMLLIFLHSFVICTDNI